MMTLTVNSLDTVELEISDYIKQQCDEGIDESHKTLVNKIGHRRLDKMDHKVSCLQIQKYINPSRIALNCSITTYFQIMQ